MAHTTFQARHDASPTASVHLSVPTLGMTFAAFALISFLLCMLLGMAVPEWGLHRPWLQFYLGLTGFDLRSLGLGAVQSFAFGSYAGVLIALLFNVFNRRFG